MVIETARCMSCNACVVACQLTNGVPANKRRNWVRRDRRKAALYFQPGNCMQCERPSCVAACPTGATYRDEADGIVKVNTRLCIGCGSCVPACPYGARFRHPERRVVDKCDFCIGRVKAGKEPACVETCPTRARVFGDLSDPTSRVAHLVAEKKTVRVVNAKVDTEPHIRYLEGAWPLDWPVEPTLPTAVGLWKSPFNPLAKGMITLSALGVLVMLGKQLLSSRRGPDPGHEPPDAPVGPVAGKEDDGAEAPTGAPPENGKNAEEPHE